MALRNSLVAKIWNAIEKSPFTVADFDVTFGDMDELLSISFRHTPDFYLVATENRAGEVFIRIAPGEHKTSELVRLSSLADIPEYVTKWGKNIREELRVILPVYSELDDLRETIEKHVAEHVDHPEMPFTLEEVEGLKEKLDELMGRFQEMQQRSELTEQELNRLNQEVTTIKANLGSFPKGVWYKTAANKIWATFSKVATSQESRQVMAQAAKKLLGLDSNSI